MRVQSINQTYPKSCKKQNSPSFQATGILIGREIQGEKMKAVAHELFKVLNEGDFSALGKAAVGEQGLLDHIVINTPVDYDDAVVPLVEEFAKKHGFDYKILSYGMHGSTTYEVMEATGWIQAREYGRTGHF